MLFLRQATTSQEILLGPFLDSTDGNTAETGLTIANTDIKLWKEGGTTESNKNSGGATHIANGRYYAVLDNTDTATAGKLEVNVHVAGALAVRREYMVLPANVYDSLVYATDFLDVSAVQLAGQTITAAAGVTFPSSVASPTNITGGTITTTTNLTNLPSIPANWLTAAGIASGALNGKGDWNIGKTGYTLTQSFPANFASLSITAGGLVDPVVASVAGAVWNAATASYGSGGSYGLLIETNLDAQVSTVGGGSLTAADIADAVWDEAIASHLTGGSTGAALNGAGSAGDPWTATMGGYGAGTAGKIFYDNINATISSRATQTSVDTVDDLLDTEMPALTAAVAALPTAGAVADAVWDEPLSGHLTAGSTGEALDGAGGGGGGVADWTADEKTVIRAVLGIPGSGTTPADPTTGILDTIRDNAVAIKAKTDNLPSDPADASDIAASFTALSAKVDAVDDLLDTEMPALTAAVASVQTDTNDIQARLPAALVGGRMDANLGAINNSTTAVTGFHRAVKGNVIGTVGAGSTTTSIVTSSLLPVGSVADKFKGRYLVFADDTTTVNLRGQATEITANTSAAAPTFTVVALTTAPVSTDTFSIT